MFRKILVPTDLTAKGLKALEIAFKICSREECEITLLHVIETIEDTDEEEFQPFYDKLYDRAYKKMEDMAANLQKGKQNISTQILYGKRVKGIVSFAHENAVDLIVLSSHKIENVDAAEGWATISYRVAILSHCPVLMVK